MPTNRVIEIHKAMHPDKVLEMAMDQQRGKTYDESHA